MYICIYIENLGCIMDMFSVFQYDCDVLFISSNTSISYLYIYISDIAALMTMFEILNVFLILVALTLFLYVGISI